MKKWIGLLLLLMLSLNGATQLFGQPVRVGSKHFTEGYLLSEMIALLLEHEGLEVERRFNLGGTMVCYAALKGDQIDIYPEYTGTIAAEILKIPGDPHPDSLQARLQLLGLAMSADYGFENTYALVMSRPQAATLDVNTISDLVAHPELRVGLSYEFLKRQDGWDNLRKFYGLPHSAFGLEHGLAYKALQEGKMDITDAYSTDGEIPSYDLVVLTDDRQFFPEYKAVALYRTDLSTDALAAANRLAGQISEAEMQALNAEVLFSKVAYPEAARKFLERKGLITRKAMDSSAHDIVGKTLTHVQLTFLALLMSMLVAIPLSVFIYWNQTLAAPVIYFTGLLQTIPSIALLAVLIPLTGIGMVPAVIALFLYGLLPIVRNTVTGLNGVDRALKNVAEGMGMSKGQKLRFVEFPLAMPSILSGIRTAAVINVGTATLAAFIGAGGLGEFIVTGLALNNYTLILQGAIPAALLAIVIELIFEGIERLLVAEYLRS